MITLLSRIFIKNGKEYTNPVVRRAYGLLAGVVGILLNVLLFAGKYTAGLLSGSVSVMADAFNNLSDAGSSFITLLGFHFAGKEPDTEHPFGHGRIEYVSGLGVSVLIIVMGAELFRSSIVKVIRPESMEINVLTIVVLVASILVKLWMSGFNRTIGRIIGSETLIATAADSRNDVLSTGAVLIAAVLCRVTGWNVLDGLMGVGVAAFILISGWGLVMDTLSPLLGESPSEDLVDHIEQKVLSYPGVLGMHDLMVHDYGPGRLMITLHAEVPAHGDIMAMHDVIDNIEKELMEKLHCHAVIHMDPIVTDGSVTALKEQVAALVKQVDPGLTIHDFRVVRGTTHDNLIFDAVLPFSSSKTPAQAAQEIRALVRAMDGNYYAVVTVEHSYTD